MLSSAEVLQLLFALVGAIMSGLLIVIAFFLKRLAKNVELVPTLVANLENLDRRLMELVKKVEMLNDLRIEVATIKAKLASRIKHDKGNGVDTEA
jgi:hypothetical protein